MQLHKIRMKNYIPSPRIVRKSIAFICRTAIRHILNRSMKVVSLIDDSSKGLQCGVTDGVDVLVSTCLLKRMKINSLTYS